VLFNADNGKLACGTQPGCDLPPTTSWYQSKTTNFGPRVALSWAPEKLHNKTVFRVGAGYYYGPGQTEDQVQPIDSDRATRTLTTGIAFPVNPATVLAGYNINDPNLGYQPRAYSGGYTLPEKVLSYTASIQQQIPGNAVLTVAYVGSHGVNSPAQVNLNPGMILGAGSAARDGAGKAAREFGAHVALVEHRLWGGSCPNVACRPTKAYVIAAELMHDVRGHGRTKVLFGTNYPMITPQKALQGLAELKLDDEATELFLAGNATRVFALSGGGAA